MILLLHSKGPKYQAWISRYVRTVKYDKIEEIPDCIRTMAISLGAIGTSASVNPPPDFQTSEEQKIKSGNEEIQQRHPLNPSDDEPPFENGGQEESQLSPEKILAARTIEAAYCRFMTRKNERLKGIDATRARLWFLLHDRASSMGWQGNIRYKLLMQGPLVHVLVCLDVIKMSADRANKVTKKQLRGDDHRRLEELMEKFDWSR
jgi:hypothetical protein